MAKNFWIALSLISGIFAGSFAMAEESPSEKNHAGAAPQWWVIALRDEPAICGQTRSGQFLCLHPTATKIPLEKPAGELVRQADFSRFADLITNPATI